MSRKPSTSASKTTPPQAATPPVSVELAPSASSSRGRFVAFGPLLLFGFLYVLLTLGLMTRVPQGLPPDENEHLEYVAYVAQHGRLPLFTRHGGNGPGFEFHQPPAYYTLGALAYRVAPPGARLLVVRGVSLACGLGVLALAWAGVGALFPNRREVQTLVVGLLALSPWHQGMGAGVNNDALAGLVGAAIFWAVARLGARPGGLFAPLLLGALAGLAVLTKATVMLLVPVCLGAAWQFAPKKTGARVRDVLTCGAVMLAMCGPWLWRNAALYGDPLALGAISERFAHNGSSIENFRSVDALTYGRAVGQILLCTAFGILGGPNTALRYLTPFSSRGPIGLQALNPLAAFSILLLILVCALASLCAILGFVRELRELKSWPAPAKRAGLWWLLGALLVIAWLLRFNMQFFQAQARYLQPTIVPLALAFALGWRNLFARRARVFAIAFGVVLVTITLWNIFGWRTLN